MIKKGSKQQFKKMDIPVESDFASNLFDKQKAAVREREEMKRLVLSQEMRQEEEELMVSSRTILSVSEGFPDILWKIFPRFLESLRYP